MASITAQQLYLRLGKSYLAAIQQGCEAVQISMTTLEDILAYIDGENNDKSRIFVAPDDRSDDYVAEEVVTHTKEGYNDGSDGIEPVSA